MLCILNILKVVSKYGSTSQEENKDENQVKARHRGSYFQQVKSHFRHVQGMLKVITF